MPADDRDLTRAIDGVLAEIAAEFTAEVRAATSLTAAAFRVSRIGGMWSARLGRILDRLLDAAEQAAAAVATATGRPLPDGWNDLPGRAEDPRTLPAPVRDWLQQATSRLSTVGERLQQAARDTLADGLAADETPDQLRDRLLAAFAADGPQLGPGRAERIARTEATAAWSAGQLAAARALTADEGGPALVKRWVARRDGSTRSAHRAAHGQTRALDKPFEVGGVAMDAPGDPTAPPALTINCRCELEITAPDRSAAVDPKALTRVHVFESKESPVESTVRAAASDHYTSAMIALVPTEADTARLAIAGGEPADQLHLTLLDLGDAAAYSAEDRAALIATLTQKYGNFPGSIPARLFGAAHWNPSSDHPAWVWSVTDLPAERGMKTNALHSMHQEVSTAHLLEIHPDISALAPAQHSPWQPHITAAYSTDPAVLSELAVRLGDVTFDRLRVAFAGEHVDIPLAPEEVEESPTPDDVMVEDEVNTTARAWHTPPGTALAFENTETGDGRVFAPGSLYWNGTGPWPLQYADEMLTGHDGAELAGAIQHLARDGDRITGTGVLYPSRPAGADALMLLEEGAPLGVSIDLDDVTLEVYQRTADQDDVLLTASVAAASITPHADGAWTVHATAPAAWTASGTTLLRTGHHAQWTTGPDGAVAFGALRDTLSAAGISLTAAAGDPDDPARGELVHTESSGDALMRVTRARVRGATLVAMPAYDQARIVLAPTPTSQPLPAEAPALQAASATMQRVITYVATSPAPVGARRVAHAIGLTMDQARRYLSRAALTGHIVRLARGLYVGAPTLPEQGEVTAAASGDTGLPIHPDREYEWDGDAAASRILKWATAPDGEVDADRLGTAFLYRSEDADPATLAAYKLPFADVFDDELHIVPRAVFAIASVLQGGRGGVDIPAAEQDEIRDRVEDLYERLAEALDDPALKAPWEDADDEVTALALHTIEAVTASFWTKMREAPPPPAAWFREPTLEEMPPGSGGVHYDNGRIYGWVVPHGEPHVGMPGKDLTLAKLGPVDFTHYLRTTLTLDDGSTVRVGSATMNVGHHRDGAECETAACQFDDSRTVAGVVTVGVNERGMWFSGAANPDLSDWDHLVFKSNQMSYHMKQGRDRRWQLRAVLSVPVPGHSSPLVAASIAERSNMALAASAAAALTPGGGRPEPARLVASSRPAAVVTPEPAMPDTPTPAELAAALADPTVLDAVQAALAKRRAVRDETAQLRTLINEPGPLAA